MHRSHSGCVGRFISGLNAARRPAAAGVRGRGQAYIHRSVVDHSRCGAAPGTQAADELRKRGDSPSQLE